MAEDEPHLRRMLQFILEREGWQVLLASDGEEALEIARRERPDLLLMDIMMPRRDGLNVVRQLRASEEFKATPVILLTALADSRDRVRGLETGADDYVAKPFDPREVVARVKAQLRTRELAAGALSAERVRVALETAGAAAHEMSQPLTVMMGNIDLLLMRIEPGDPLRPLVEKIQQNGARAIALLRKMQTIQSYTTKPYLDQAILDLEQASPIAEEAPGAKDESGERD